MNKLWPNLILGSPTSQARRLHQSLTGPTSLRSALISNLNDFDNRKRAITGINGELSRIQRALIASFLHPNTNGAQRYANEGVKRYNQHLAEIPRPRPGGPPPALPGGPETFEQRLVRFGLRGPGPLRGDVGHVDIDSIAVTVVTERRSDARLGSNMLLAVTKTLPSGQVVTREFMLNLEYRVNNVMGMVILRKFYPDFEPATTTKYTVSTNDELRLEEITGFDISMGPDPLQGSGGTVWRPRRISVELNGRVVHDVTFAREKQIRAGQSLRLDYPQARHPTTTDRPAELYATTPRFDTTTHDSQTTLSTPAQWRGRCLFADGGGTLVLHAPSQRVRRVLGVGPDGPHRHGANRSTMRPCRPNARSQGPRRPRQSTSPHGSPPSLRPRC